ncbi:cellulose-growth-specific protein [Phialemonium atrogriseum]|uniref:lytic cellulose monooxygenase (C4-dehydrogenating) n=1 Tax=Phialemonium atrogriseum TaxID=1093897 RepID=A0AAJ0FD90_9PEZI|nr:cellulose-growth-specific protein [Phialemonium atrogriseum]KAK1764351.1 cellulose-growth-specific protein [Phialemonium atrogriseum]
MISTVFSTVALFAAGAAAHGAVTSYVIAGTNYPGYQGFSPANSPNVIQWQWPDYNPVMSATDSKLRCNGGTSATLNATAAPGDKISATWQQWTHSQGPILVWMYKCAGAFHGCDGSGAEWFKIDAAGFHGDGTTVFLDSETNSGWDIAKLVGGNKQWTSTIPAGLAPGNYLVRHELIALHQAKTPQWYPECAQIVITGSGTSQPSASQKAAIPGYCKQSDPNISFNINDHSAPQTYVIPGPPVFTGTGAAAPKKAKAFAG